MNPAYEKQARLQRIAANPDNIPARDLPVTDEDRAEAKRQFPGNGRGKTVEVTEELDWSNRPIIGKRDDELAKLLARPYPEGIGNRIRHDHGRRQWLIWDGVRWAPDLTKDRHNLLRDRRADYLIAATTKEEVMALAYLMDIRKQDHVFEALSTMDPVKMSGLEFDLNPDLLGVRNGQVNLKTGELQTGNPADLISMTTNASYDPDTDIAKAAPRFMQFMHEITGGNEAMVEYILLVIGSSLFGHVEPQQFYVLVGVGNNGKGVLSNVIAYALGDYATAPSRMLYMRSRHGEANSSAARPDLVNLKGRRFAHMSEPTGGSFNEDLLKEHTGGDLINARDLFDRAGSAMTFAPTHTIFFRTNNPPKLENVGVAMARRLRAIPFRQDFSAKPDFSLEQRLKTEADDILAILVHYAGKYAADPSAINKLPADVAEASAQYLEDSDPLSAFIHDRCVVEAGQVTTFSDLQGAYLDWHKAQNDPDLAEMSTTKLGLALTNRFAKQQVNNRAGYRGIGLISGVGDVEEKPWWDKD